MGACFQQNALSYLLVLRLIPLLPFWRGNLVPAFLGVSLKVFALGTLIGIIPGSLVSASVGNGLGAIFAAGHTDSITHAIYKPEVLLPIAGLFLLSLLPVLSTNLRHTTAKRGENGHSRRPPDTRVGKGCASTWRYRRRL